MKHKKILYSKYILLQRENKYNVGENMLEIKTDKVSKFWRNDFNFKLICAQWTNIKGNQWALFKQYIH